VTKAKLPGRNEMVRRQRLLADFGDFALGSDDLDEVLNEACRLVGEALGTDLAKVLEIEDRDGERRLFVRAGVGWPPGVVGRLRLPARDRSSETYAIDKGVPVITPDIGEEGRFEFPDFMKSAGVVGAVNVPIFLPGRTPYGLLQVDSRKVWAPDRHDTEFLRTYATLLGPVIDRLHKVHALSNAERRNETLLRELQHRIKNNITAITSLVESRRRLSRSDEVRAELGVVGERIGALRLVHEQIYATGATDRLPLGPYVTELLAGLLGLHRERRVGLDVRIGDVEVTSDGAVPLGLILNEFATNSLKHAFGPGDGGRISVEAERRGERLWLRIADNGRGLPEGNLPDGRRQTARRGSGTGVGLIEGLARQIGATPQWSSDGGTALTIEF